MISFDNYCQQTLNGKQKLAYQIKIYDMLTNIKNSLIKINDEVFANTF